jgi:hypothetical protein
MNAAKSDIDIEAIRAEFAEFAGVPARREGDIDSEQLAEALGIGVTTARRRIKQIAAERPDYELMEVREGTAMRWVLRKVG